MGKYIPFVPLCSPSSVLEEVVLKKSWSGEGESGGPHPYTPPELQCASCCLNCCSGIDVQFLLEGLH